MIDQRVLEAYLDYSGDQARRFIIECDQPEEGETVEQWMLRNLRAAGRLPEGYK